MQLDLPEEMQMITVCQVQDQDFYLANIVAGR
jgi:hypothetical protein